jgi:hypothetical protein
MASDSGKTVEDPAEMISPVTAPGSTVGRLSWLIGASVGTAADSSVSAVEASVSISSVSTGTGAVGSTAGGGAQAPNKMVISIRAEKQKNKMRFIRSILLVMLLSSKG